MRSIYDIKRYKVIDFWDEMPELIGYYDTIEEAKKAREEREIDTDDECDVSIFDTVLEEEVEV